MVEGGGELGYNDPGLDKKLDHNDDEEEDEEDEVDTTWPFQPGKASTPYHGGEEIEMQTMQHEQSGLPDTSYEETLLLGVQAEQKRSWTALKNIFPDASAIDLETSYKKGRLQVKMMGYGKKLYPLFTKEKGTGKQQLNPQLTKEIKESLSPMAQELIDEKNENIRTERQNLRDAKKQLKEVEKASQVVQDLRKRNERTQAKIVAIQDDQGSNVESEAELRRLLQLKKNLETDFEKAKKE